MSYRADIDGLRSIAVLLVLVFHFNLMGVGDAGFVGVDVFFVISGYLISSIIWREMAEGCFSLGHFYMKRVRRLAPALIVVQLVVLALAAAVLLPSEVLSVSKESLFAQLYLSNFYYWRAINYFGGQSNSSFLLHTWSLGVEEQFYLFYPFLLLAVHSFVKRAFVPVLVALCLASFALNIVMVHLKPQATFYLLPTRAWEMLLGALVTRIEPRLAMSGAMRAGVGMAAIALLATTLAIYGPGVPVPGWFALMPSIATCLFLMAGAGAGGLVSRLLGMRAPVWIGRISYPLYLVHWPIHIFAMTLLPSYGLAWRWAMFGLSFLAAWGIYRGIEERVRRQRWLPSDRCLFVAYIGNVAFVLVIAASAFQSGGWRFRFSPEVLRIADAADTYDPRESALDYGGGPIEPFLRPVGAKHVAPHWMAFGDSHAGALAEAVSLWLAGRGEAGDAAFRSGCMPLVDTGDTICRKFTAAMFEYLAAHREIGAVLLISIWRQPIEAGFTDASGRVVGGPEAVASFDAALHATLGRLHRLGVRTYVWEPLPAMPRAVPQSMARSLVFGDYWPNSIPLSEHSATFGFFEAGMAREAPLIAGRVNGARTLCASQVCRASYRGSPLYEDNNHPSVQGAQLFATILTNSLVGVPPVFSRP